jgi:hypothetical protein
LDYAERSSTGSVRLNVKDPDEKKGANEPRQFLRLDEDVFASSRMDLALEISSSGYLFIPHGQKVACPVEVRD